jgi:addiction module RelE/StbE family toxin
MRSSTTTSKKNEPHIEYSQLFIKQLKATPHEIKLAFRDALALFLEDPSAAILREHPLKKRLSGYRSIDVTTDYRALYKVKITGKQKIITFHKIGTHTKLYSNLGEK